MGEDLSKNSRERTQTAESELQKAHGLENLSTGYLRLATLTEIWPPAIPTSRTGLVLDA